ncbi:biotin/lipoyl-binding protein [Paracoccus sp. DMF-8]|uniref:ATP-binding protein n=1 Tax=Paracoccus sp. DMF-8 TaxID=3019445 RepID=UPI0023E82443|nr:biotin/lipoyl-containing protein [Paracoccus sp. DMF-8]MDF3606007.1 biotin/lipoyl-binding protein [Paracoccus sp. DMF-8]
MRLACERNGGARRLRDRPNVKALNSFGDDRDVSSRNSCRSPRHIEIQVLGDQHGNIALPATSANVSIQRRHQKVVEEAPSALRRPKRPARPWVNSAVALAKAVGYYSAGTVELIVDGDRNFYFLEMNTRLQVEHPVTELITGVDLVEQMIRIANGEPLPFKQEDLKINGWAMESRLYAEDPYRNFLPSIGRLTRYRPPAEIALDDVAVRNDTGVFEGGEISMFYDPMIAKLCTWAPTREKSIDAMRMALNEFEVEGIGHNLPFLSAVMDHPRFVSGNITTAFIAEEYPEGFLGATLSDEVLDRLAAAAAAMFRVAEIRRTRITGRLDNHERHVGEHWVVVAQGREIPVRITADKGGSTVQIGDRKLRVESDWLPGQTLARINVDSAPLVVKVERRSSGFRMRLDGADLKVHVRRPRAAELARLMPEKLPPDTSNLLLCPMPGLVVKINVEVGDEVQDGQALATVEAMKMENILRAEKKAVIKAIHAAPGQSLAVDEIIMEFE